MNTTAQLRMALRMTQKTRGSLLRLQKITPTHLSPFNSNFNLGPIAIASINNTSNSPKMTTKVAVFTKNSPMAIPGIYSQAIVAGNFVFCSGAVAMDLSGKIIDGDIQDHTRQCIKNLTAVLEAAGSSIDKVVKVNVFLSNIDDFQKMNEEYMKHWGETKPSRTCVAAKTLPLNTDVEIECIAAI